LLFSAPSCFSDNEQGLKNMYPYSERRHHPRVKIKLPVVGRTGNALVDGEIKDLSLGGAYILCPAVFEVNATFQVVISVAGRLVSIKVEMIWLDVRTLDNHTRMRGMGVRFRQIFNGDRSFLLDVITKRHQSRLVAWLSRKPRDAVGQG
jgi:hypothetical protein